MEAKDAKKETKDWAEMSDDDEQDAQVEAKEEAKEEPAAAEEKPAKVVPPAQKGFKNDRGDYVVTSINIPDLVSKKKTENQDDDDSSDSDSEGYGSEEDAKPEAEEAKVPESKWHPFFHLECLHKLTFYRNPRKIIVKERETGLGGRRTRETTVLDRSEGRGQGRNQADPRPTCCPFGK